MATEKTYQLLAIARRRLFVNEIITRRTKFELTKRIIELARRARRENLVELKAFVDIGVNRVGNDPKVVYARVAREIFDDGVVHWGRIVAFFALAIYFQRRFARVRKGSHQFCRRIFSRLDGQLSRAWLMGRRRIFYKLYFHFALYKTGSCRASFWNTIVKRRIDNKDCCI